MTWITPRTWLVGEVVTASKMNEITSNLNHLAPPTVDTTVRSVVSTNIETTLVTHAITGGSLSTNRQIQFLIIGDVTNNTGAGQTFVFRVKYGATTLFDDATTSLAASGTARAFHLHATIVALGATNSQMLSMTLRISGQTGTTAGLGDLGDAAGVAGAVASGTAAIDSTANQNLVVTAQPSTSSAQLSVRALYSSWRAV